MIEKMSESQWDKILKQQNVVFARTTPAQKLSIIKVFAFFYWFDYNGMKTEAL